MRSGSRKKEDHHAVIRNPPASSSLWKNAHCVHIRTKRHAGGSQISREPSVRPHDPWFKTPVLQRAEAGSQCPEPFLPLPRRGEAGPCSPGC